MSVKDKILETAYRLFGEYGYEKTSVQKIVEESGTSKGGFYHHFKTKEDVVEAITYGFVGELELQYIAMTQDGSVSVYEKMNRVIKILNSYKVNMIGQWPGLNKMFSFEGNFRVIHSMAVQFESLAKQTYFTIIQEGISKNEFHTEFPMQAAQLFARETLNIYNQLAKIILEEDQKVYDEFILNLDFTQNVLNSALGIKEDSLNIKQEALEYLKEVKKRYKKE